MVDELWPASLAGGSLNNYFHVCAFFNSEDEEYRVLLPFIREGLEWGEKAMHIWDAGKLETHRCRLAEGGLEAAHWESKGQLQILSFQEAYLQDGNFDQDRMLATVEAAIAQGKEQGYPRSRLIGHMEWALEGYPGSEQLLEYEVRVNDVLARNRQPAVCVYDVNRLNANLMLDILRAHPLSIVAGILHENPFFTPPEEFLEEIRTRKQGSVAA